MPTIVEELKQRKPFPSKAQEAAVTLLRTAEIVNRHLDSVIAHSGITGQQYNVLRILRGAGAEGLPTLEIASRMIEQAPGITRLLDRLETKKLVERRRESEDLRCVYCRITPTGRNLLATLDEPVRHATDEAFQSVNNLELARLVRSLDHVRESLQKKEEHP